MIVRRIVCLFAGHDYTTIVWWPRSKVWRQRECLRCGKRQGNGHVPPARPPLRVVDAPKPSEPERTFR